VSAPSARLRALVVDDEPLAREGVRQLLAAEPDIDVVGECATAAEARAAVAALAPELLFLDISLPDESGLALAAALPGALPGPPATEAVGSAAPLVVFVTAYEAHAVRAFELHAVDYVLKPLRTERFAAAVARARMTVATRQRAAAHERLLAALAALPGGAAPVETPPVGTASSVTAPASSPASAVSPASATSPTSPTSPAASSTAPAAEPAPLERVTVRSGRKLTVVRLADVEWIAADGDYVRLHTAAGSAPLLRTPLGELARRLDPRAFLRAHRSAVVNVDAVRGLQLGEHGDYALVLRSGARVRVSRAYRDAVLAALGATLPPA
jgi:two-component system, LytTR family, response regulator